MTTDPATSRRNTFSPALSAAVRRKVAAGLCAVSAAAYASVSCSGGDGAGASASGEAGIDARSNVPPLDFSAFDSAVNAFLAQNGLAGASAVVVQKDYGIVHEKGYGSFAADRLYLIASSSKVMSVGILMRLVDEGKLDIDKPISDYLSTWGTYKTDITVAQLVSNSSGLVTLADNPLYAPYLCQYLDTGMLSDCAKAIYTANDAADIHPPDTKFDYGGGQWQLAGGIAEVVSGKPWAQLVKEAYVDPCGTPSIGYNNQYQRAFGVGEGGVGSALSYPPFFQSDAGTLAPTKNPNVEGGAYTTAHDYGKILLMQLRGGMCDGGRVLSEASVARMQQDRIGTVYGGSTSNPNLEGYGLGWWVDRMHPGVVADPGAYGAIPWIDVPRKYAAMILLEASATGGGSILLAAKPALDAILGPIAGYDGGSGGVDDAAGDVASDAPVEEESLPDAGATDGAGAAD